MKHFFHVCLISISFSALGQTIEVPSGTPLTVQGNLNLPAGFSIQYNSQNYVKAPAVGSFNTYLGLGAGNSGAGIQNSFFGYQAGLNTTAGANTFLGYQAGLNTTNGAANVFIGSLAGFSNVSGQGNLFLGQQAGANSTGSFNLFMGNGAGGATTTGGGNTAIGDGVALHNTTGARNTAIGQYAGLNNQTGTDNVFIGFGAKAGTANPTDLVNAAAIGANAIVSQNNSMVLGNGVNVGIGTSVPSARLHLATGVANSSGLRLENLTSGSPASVLTQTKFLTVDASGNVVLGSLNSSARISASTELWQAHGEYVQNTTSEGVIIGSQITSTPAGYKLYVADGILTEKVKVAVKSTADWSDKVFESNYPLKRLSEVATYIKTNKHLPGVPSAAEVVEKGVDVVQMDAKLLEKIEELTLYMIELKKENQEMKKEINQLIQNKNK
jgi:carbonic anhydrase/acetyltransferase-like protein (isoleucine patch superfamily)